MEDKKIIVIKGLEGNSPTSLSETQQFLLENIDIIKTFYWVLFLGIVLWVLYFKFYKENRKVKSKNKKRKNEKRK